MLDTIWNLIQGFQIADNETNTKNVASVARSTSVSVKDLQRKMDTLVLANQAMWELLSAQLGLSESDLVKKMNEIDLRDGKLDGRMTPIRQAVTECTQCGKKIGRRNMMCYWCGARVEGVSPFSS